MSPARFKSRGDAPESMKTHENRTPGSLLGGDSTSCFKRRNDLGSAGTAVLIRHSLSTPHATYDPVLLNHFQIRSFLLQMELYKTHQRAAVPGPPSALGGNTANTLLPTAEPNANPAGWQNARWENKVKELRTVTEDKDRLKPTPSVVSPMR